MPWATWLQTTVRYLANDWFNAAQNSLQVLGFALAKHPEISGLSQPLEFDVAVTIIPVQSRFAFVNILLQKLTLTAPFQIPNTILLMKNFRLMALMASFCMVFSCSKDSGADPEPDSTAPQLTISIAGFTDSGSVTPVVSKQLLINIDADDAGGVAMVEAYIDDQKKGEDRSAPFSIAIDVSGYTSKGPTSAKYQDYVLRVVATDASGNSSERQVVFNIDNELPSITAVTLQAETLLNGDTNEVSFSATDNEALTAIDVLVNDDILVTLDQEPYAFNLNTLGLDDGPNTLSIRVADAAGNTKAYSVIFIVDNSGPTIDIQNLANGDILDVIRAVTANATDPYAGFESAELLIDGQSSATFSAEQAIAFEIDPESLSFGVHEWTIRAQDSLQNVSEYTLSAEVRRRLITLEIPANYLNPGIPYQYFVFASKLDGTLLSSSQIQTSDANVILLAPVEIGPDEPFMITFASIGLNAGVANYLNTYRGVTRSQLQTVRPDDPGTYMLSRSIPVNANGIDPNYNLQITGADYYQSTDGNGGLILNEFQPSGIGGVSRMVYASIMNPINEEYAFQVVDKPVPSGFSFDFQDFSNQGVSSGNFVTVPASYMNQHASNLSLFGFESADAFDTNAFHLLYSNGFGAFIKTSFNYPIVDYFSSYSHLLNVGNYHEEGPGLPPSSHTIPDWTIDPAYDGQTVAVNATGTGHSIGKISFSNDGGGPIPYEWNITFDSQATSSLIVPELPSVLSGKAIYDLVESGSMVILQSELRQYNALEGFTAYADQLVRLNGPWQRPVESFMSIFNSSYGDAGYWKPETTFFRN